MKKIIKQLITLTVMALSMQAYSQTLNTNVGLYTPYARDYLLNIKRMTAGIDENVDVGVHISKQYSGVIAGLEINGVNVIDSRSIGGSAWQSSYLLSAPGNNDIFVFNQAAGNSVSFVWGYDNYDPNPVYNPIYSDHRHPGGDFSNTEAHCPCPGYTATAVDQGRPQVNVSTKAVNLKNRSDTTVVHINNQYTLRSISGNQSWDKYALEQAFYLSRTVAAQHQMKAYMKFRSDNKIYKVDLTSLRINYPVIPQNSVVGVSPVTMLERRFEVPPSNLQVDIQNQYYNPRLDYVVFEWVIDGEKLGVAIDMPSSVGFGGAHLTIAQGVFCLDLTDFSCGNINWHSWIYDLERDATKTRLNIGANQTRTYSMDYYIGSIEQLNALGYFSSTVADSPPIEESQSIVPVLNLLLLSD